MGAYTPSLGRGKGPDDHTWVRNHGQGSWEGQKENKNEQPTPKQDYQSQKGLAGKSEAGGEREVKSAVVPTEIPRVCWIERNQLVSGQQIKIRAPPAKRKVEPGCPYSSVDWVDGENKNKNGRGGGEKETKECSCGSERGLPHFTGKGEKHRGAVMGGRRPDHAKTTDLSRRYRKPKKLTE